MNDRTPAVPTLTVSTLGAPDVPLSTIVGDLRDAGITQIELRTVDGQLAWAGMPEHECTALREQLAAAGIAISGLASYVRVAGAEDDEQVIAQLRDHLRLAQRLGTGMVRMFPGAPVQPSPFDTAPALLEDRSAVARRAARRLDAVADLAGELGVLPVLETHDSHPRGEDVAGILDRVDGPVGVVWDLMHPWRVGEPIERTWELLSPWLRDGRGSVQVKDAALPADPAPVPIGQGTLPVDGFAELLRANDYDGLICLEWEKAWHPDAADLDVAIASTRQWYDRHWPEPDHPVHAHTMPGRPKPGEST